MQRIFIIGPAGAGKTTLAFRLAEKFNIPATDLDALRRRPDRTRIKDDFYAAARKIADGARWVISGVQNSNVRSMLLSRADTVVWLDYGLIRTFKQVAYRTFVQKPEQSPAGIPRQDYKALGLSLVPRTLAWFPNYFYLRNKLNKIFQNTDKYKNIGRFVRLRSRLETEAFVSAFSFEGFKVSCAGNTRSSKDVILPSRI